MSIIKKLFVVSAAVYLLFVLTGCPGIPGHQPTVPEVLGTYTITNDDKSESTVVFYSDNTYTEGEEDYIAVKGTFTGTVAEGKMVTLTPVEINFSEEDGVDLFMTLEQAVEAFGDNEEALLIIAVAFIEQDYTVSGTTLINVTGDDGNDGDGVDDGDEPPSDGPAAIATFTESTISMTFIFYNDETYEQLMSGNTLATGQYAPNDDETELTMTPTTFAFYFYIDPDGPGAVLSDEVKYMQFTLEDAIEAALDDENEITAPLRQKQGVTEDTIRTQLAYIFNSVSFGTLTLGADQNGKTLTVPESEYVFHEVKD